MAGMRIAMITGEYPPMEGGVGAYTHQLATALATAGHTIDVLTSPAKGGRTDVVREGAVTVHRCITRWGLQGILRTRRWIRRLSPDVVNVQYEPAAYEMRAGITFARALASTQGGAPLVVTFHDLLPPYLFPKAGPLRQWRVWQLAHGADGIVVTNREDLARLGRALHDTPPPTRLIPIGSNISASPPSGYDRAAWRARYGYGPDDLIVGFFGFLNRTKGIETLLEALAILNAGTRPAHLLLIGGRTGTSDVTNAAYADEVDALIEALGLSSRVHRTGFAEATDVSAALLGVDICALPYREGANLRHGTLHAALAHGCATVTTAAADPAPELRDGENVVVVPPGNAVALADAILRVAKTRCCGSESATGPLRSRPGTRGRGSPRTPRRSSRSCAPRGEFPTGVLPPVTRGLGKLARAERICTRRGRIGL